MPDWPPLRTNTVTVWPVYLEMCAANLSPGHGSELTGVVSLSTFADLRAVFRRWVFPNNFGMADVHPSLEPDSILVYPLGILKVPAACATVTQKNPDEYDKL